MAISFLRSPWLQLLFDVLSFVTLAHSVGNGYQQRTLVGEEFTRKLPKTFSCKVYFCCLSIKECSRIKVNKSFSKASRDNSFEHFSARCCILFFFLILITSQQMGTQLYSYLVLLLTGLITWGYKNTTLDASGVFIISPPTIFP